MARLAVRSDSGTKLFVLLSGDDRNDVDTVVRLDDRTCLNVEEIVLTTYGPIATSDHGHQTLYPWAQVFWMDSASGSELR
jgi:hypothetical protein